MASVVVEKESFADLLNETFGNRDSLEGSVVKGHIIAIENDFALIDAGLKSEGRVALNEFSSGDGSEEIRVGDVVDVYLERMEMARLCCRAKRRAARKLGAYWKKRLRRMRRLRVRFLAGLKAASPLIFPVLWPSCRAAK